MPQEHSQNTLSSETRQHSARDYDMDRFAVKRVTREVTVSKKHPMLETIKKDAKVVNIYRAVSDSASSSRLFNRLPHISSGSAFYSNVIAQRASTLSKGIKIEKENPERTQTESPTPRAALH